MADEMQRRDQQRCEQCRHRASTSTSSSAVATESMTVVVYPTTGGHFELSINRTGTVDGLKKAISKKLKVAKERLCLLHKDRQLQEGSLLDNNIQEGNKITLLPIVETGLLTQRPDQCVLQALESLNDSQINDFLSGKAPLNLTMRLGDHMMFIQLQLSTASSAAETTRRDVIPPSEGPTPAPNRITTVSTDDDRDRAADATAVGGRPTTREIPQRDASPNHVTHLLDTDTLVEASRSLSNTLKHLSTKAADEPDSANRIITQECDHRQVQCSANNRGRAGAIIESMHHHGKGVYSGTFSGTLNPALQDRNGHPKRDISTIVHILNDLLGASPQYRRHQHSRQTPVDALAMSLAARGSSGVRRRASDKTVSSKCEEDFSRLSQENMATRGKMEQLRVMMEERRSRRRARREIRLSPYRLPWGTMGIVGDAGGRKSTVAIAAHPAMEIVVDGQGLTEPSCSAAGSSENAMDCTASCNEEYLTPNPVVA